LASVCAVGALAAPLQAQIRYEAADAHVEVLGLHRWTLKMLQDSIAHYAKGQKLEDAACMVTLRESLHFVEASVTTYSGYGAPGAKDRVKETLVVMVVEPQDSAKVKWDVRPRNEYTTLIPEYSSIVLPVTDTVGGLWGGRVDNWLQYYTSDAEHRASAIARVPAKSRDAAQADAERLWKFLDEHRSEDDRVRALRVLRTDGFNVNRYVAAMVLMSFPASDSTWWALARALRDPHERVRGAARTALYEMAPRRIDWTPVATDLRLLVGGTNLPSLLTTFEVLDRTQIDPKLASTLLHNNAQWVLDHMGATYPSASYTAHKLLVRLNAGVDLGKTRADWETWATTR
jgi:hypothetical protein